MKSLSVLISVLLCGFSLAQSQTGTIQGKVTGGGDNLPLANVIITSLQKGTTTDEEGTFLFEQVPAGEYELKFSYVGYKGAFEKILVSAGETTSISVDLKPSVNISEVVVSGTMSEVSRLESPVPVEVYSAEFLKNNPTPSLFDALQSVNGVRPQLNCSVCNTGDIHINGLEGAYTMILIDGMPIVSGLSTVYGLSGIPTDMIERIEVVKGPASSLFGSEAVGGLVNVITKEPGHAPRISADANITSWQELTANVGLSNKIGERVNVLTGLSAFHYGNPIDNNKDNFTDMALQDRISVFQKWKFHRPENKEFSLAFRYLNEDRWGGELNWRPEFRGGDQVYGENILTNRWEVIGKYDLPVDGLQLSISANSHEQDAYYGNSTYLADQRIAFGQLVWNKRVNSHKLLFGSAVRYTFYDDNTPATQLTTDNGSRNQPSRTWLPGIFVQDEIELNEKNKLLLGLRTDYHSEHKEIFTPRFAYKWTINRKNSIRINAGTGFRVVNLFTEDHAALTGARDVEITEQLDPEQSYNVNLNYVKRIYDSGNNYFELDASAWYTHFTNQIIPDYDTDPQKIIYSNLDEYSVSRGVSVNLQAVMGNGLTARVGATAMDVFFTQEDQEGNLKRVRPILTENWTAVWSVSYPIVKWNLDIDYTGNLYGPMRLPLLGDLDPRDEFSPWWSIQNVKLTWHAPNGNWKFYGGVKNLLNFTPPANSIARSHDPFDRNVEFDESGNVLSTPQNPNALTFDPTYVYAPNQGIRFFIGFSYSLD
ncbi:TonB-dependent receptor [Halocola ammonii]